MKNYNKLIKLKKVDTETLSYSFIDFNYDNNTITPNLKQITLSNIFNDNIEKEILDIINEISSNNIILCEDHKRKLFNEILSISNNIAIKGRVGPADTILVNRENYNKYDLHELSNFDINICDVNDVYIYRKGDDDMKGLYLFYDESHYSIERIGNTEDYYGKIKIL